MPPKKYLTIAAICLLIVCNLFVFYKICCVLKEYTYKLKESQRLEGLIRADLKKIEQMEQEKELLSKSRIAKEKYLVERYSITLDPDERIIDIPKDFEAGSRR